MTVRVRFAPSPTGYLHIGGARTALFNWLFAKKNKGTFILRIEDTDEARSTTESVNAIIDSMKWLGLDWDEGPIAFREKAVEGGTLTSGEDVGAFGPYYQMKATEEGIYQKVVDELMRRGRAYYCYCTPEELEEMRKQAQAEKKMPKYDGRCCRLTEQERKQKEAGGGKPVTRFKRPGDVQVKINDLIAGEVSFDPNVLDDFVIVKASGVPTYNFAVVVDDHRMGITHVIRGNDHLSNTPKQMQLYEALGWQPPVFAHLSMILGPDGARLSKRHGHTSVLEYRNDGYLPDALRNYLALLGWSTEDSQQLFEPQELIGKFSIERCSNSPATFDPQKLLWMNGEYIRKKPVRELTDLFFKWMGDTGQADKIKNWDRALVEKLIAMEHDKFKLLGDIYGLIDIFFVEKVEYKPEAVNKVLKAPGARDVLEGARSRLESLCDFSADSLERFAREFAAERGVKTGQVFHPLRVAVSGRTTGPSLFHMMEVLGRAGTVGRINDCLQRCF